MGIGLQTIHLTVLYVLLNKNNKCNCMKVFLILFFLTAPISLLAQSNQEKLSQFLANKLRDSLSLNVKQHQVLYSINLIIEEEKKNVRSINEDPFLLRKRVQKIENKRDSLYQGVFNTEQFILYKDRKSTFLNVTMPK